MDIILLKEKSLKIRRRVLKVALSAGKGHIPPCYSWADIATVLFYGNILKISPNKPDWKDRDRFVLSKGHAALTLYSILSDTPWAVVVEEAIDCGCLGELIAKHIDGGSTKLSLMNLGDKFLLGSSNREWVWNKYGLNPSDIVKKVLTLN